jgi:hypothetical protein
MISTRRDPTGDAHFANEKSAHHARSGVPKKRNYPLVNGLFIHRLNRCLIKNTDFDVCSVSDSLLTHEAEPIEPISFATPSTTRPDLSAASATGIRRHRHNTPKWKPQASSKKCAHGKADPPDGQR